MVRKEAKRSWDLGGGLPICPSVNLSTQSRVFVSWRGCRVQAGDVGKSNEISLEPVGGPLRAYKVPSRLVGVIRFGRCSEAFKGLRTWLAWMGDSHMGAGGNDAPFGCGDDRGLEDFEEGSGAEASG